MNKTSTRQTYLVLILTTITFKLLLLPSILARDVGRDSYITVLMGQLLEFAILGIFLFLSAKYPELTFKQMLQKMFGNIVARIVLFIYAFYFLCKTMVVFVSFFIYLDENLYSKLPWYIYAIPTALVVFYVIMCGLKNITRLTEFFMPLVLIAAALCFFMGILSCDFTNVLPMFERGFFATVSPLLEISVWFGNFLIYVVLMGNIKQDKGHVKKIIIWASIASAFISVFFLIYNCIFSYNGANYTNSLADITSVLPRSSFVGSLSWVILIIWCLAIFLALSLTAFSGAFCFKEAITHKRGWIIDALVTLCIFTVAFFLNYNTSTLTVLLLTYGKYLALLVQYLLPVLMLIFSFKLKKAENKNA